MFDNVIYLILKLLILTKVQNELNDNTSYYYYDQK